MRRTGLSSILIVALIFAGFVLMLVMSAHYEGLATGQVQGQVVDTMRRNVVGELVMSANCATASRGVFHRSAVISGDLGCISPQRAVHVKFEVGSEAYTWTVGGGGGSVTETTGDVSYSQTYSVLLHDDMDDTYQRALLRVGSE